MADELLTESHAADIVRAELGGDWQISDALGTTQAIRMAEQGTRSVAIKLLRTPAAIMQRLSDLGVTPPVLALGEQGGRAFMIQQAVDGEHPDHAWFAGHREQWAAMIRRYLQDTELTELLAARRGFWRLDAPAAVDLINRDLARRPVRSPALKTAEFAAALDRWRAQADVLRDGRPTAMCPIHPDAHWHNYVLADDAPLLLDWDHIDLSDPLRDIGSQIWGFLPQRYWAEFVRRVGLVVDDDLPTSICWWAGFKMLGNAIFNDGRDDQPGVEFHVGAFMIAVDRRPWLGTE